MSCRFHVSYPTTSCHNGHDVSSWVGRHVGELSQRLSNAVITEIHTLVGEGLRDARAMQAIFAAKYGDYQGRAYHPRLKDIRCHIALALRRNQKSRVDQTEMQHKGKMELNHFNYLLRYSARFLQTPLLLLLFR